MQARLNLEFVNDTHMYVYLRQPMYISGILYKPYRRAYKWNNPRLYNLTCNWTLSIRTYIVGLIQSKTRDTPVTVWWRLTMTGPLCPRTVLILYIGLHCQTILPRHMCVYMYVSLYVFLYHLLPASMSVVMKAVMSRAEPARRWHQTPRYKYLYVSLSVCMLSLFTRWVLVKLY